MKGTTNIPEVSVVIRKGTKILFVLRQNTGYADGMYALPGGHVEAGEQFTAAAIREAKEEVGIGILPANLKPLLAMHRLGRDAGDIRIGPFFEVVEWTGTPKNMEPELHHSIAWFDAKHLPYEKIIAFQAEALRAIDRGDTYLEFGWAEPV